MMNDLHGLLQSIQIKIQAIDKSGEVLTEEIYQVAADQANLFSINAAIESTRLQRDGFSVVYGELLSLVEFTGRLTTDLREMSTQIKMRVNEVSTELEHVLNRVDPNRGDPMRVDPRQPPTAGTGTAYASTIQGEEIVSAVE